MTNARITLKGLTWGHRRARAPLDAATAAFTRENPDIAVVWESRPLSAFVSEDMADATHRYDLISFDHPFCGTVFTENLFLALDHHLPKLLHPEVAHRYIGPSLESYSVNGAVVGAPIDAAVQHGIYRADLLGAAGEPVPASWSDALALGRRRARHGQFLGAAFASPHGFLTFASLCANLGKPLPDDPRHGDVIDRAVAHEALRALRELFALTPSPALEWDSIALHDAMSSSDDIVYCPCEFGYATYGERDVARALSFSDFAGLVAPFYSGGILGGVGLGLPIAATHQSEALRFIEFVLAPQTQLDHFSNHHGQPALSSVWEDLGADKRFNGYFSSVRKTIEHAAIRPRFPGFIRSQWLAGHMVQKYLGAHDDAEATIDNLIRLFEADSVRLLRLSNQHVS